MYCSASVREHPARSATRFDSRTGSDMDQRRGIRTRSVPIRRSGTLRLFSRHWNAGQPQPAARGAGRSRVGSLEREETRQPPDRRSEEHTSELQSLMRLSYAVFCLNKKKTKKHKM